MAQREDIVAAVSAYIRSYDSYNILAYSGAQSSALNRNCEKANGIIAKRVKINYDYSELERIADVFETYMDTGRQFSVGHKAQLVDLYRETEALYETVRPGTDQESGRRHAAHKRRLKALEDGKVIYPYHVKGLQMSIQYLEKIGVNLREGIKTEADSLSDNYWEIFGTVKAKRTEGKKD